ncbi:MAG: EthD domain-containing protein, partial [Acidimicrobiaceae bacterium]|nr:EthD domain-containing protein [Acidimicrobiaceae bacterium]
ATIRLALRHRPDRAAAVIELPGPPDLASWAADLEVRADALACYRVSEALRWSRPGARLPADGGVSFISFVQRAATMDHEQFEQHWTERHRPLAIEHHQGMLLYVQNVVREQIAGPDGAALDGIAELVFATGSDVDAGLFPTEESRRIIGEDVARFIGSTTSGLYRPLQ